MTSTEIFNVKFGECSELLYNRYADNSSDLALREGKMTIEEFSDIRRNQKHFNRRYDAITGFERVFEEPKIDENWKKAHPTKYSDIEKMEIGTDKNIPVYIWLDEDGDNEHFIMKLYSKAEKIYFPEDCTGMFKLLTKVKKIDLSSFDLSKVKNMKEMFKFCYSLEEINFGNFDLKNVTNIEEMFMYCVHLKKINLSLEGIEKIAKKDFCFYDCRALEEIDFESTKKLIWNDGNNLYHRTSLKDKFQKQYIKKFILGDKLKNVYIPILNFLNKTKYKVASDEFDVDYERRFYI